MPQSLVQIYVHLVFSTKDRGPFLRDKLICEEMHDYLGGTLRDMGCPPLRVGGTEDHVHALFRLAKVLSIADLVRDIKKESSKWIKMKGESFSDFHWQEGYGAFSISPSHVDAVVQYIENQEEHHQKDTFQDEFRRLCRKYGLEIDERYAWS
ncbi:MAG: IS200/IS605 family transposase [Planctomycetes bacterium]|nr:IS200/IS605 family transposase [Planctomycetota bacterium]